MKKSSFLQDLEVDLGKICLQEKKKWRPVKRVRVLDSRPHEMWTLKSGETIFIKKLKNANTRTRCRKIANEFSNQWKAFQAFPENVVKPLGWFLDEERDLMYLSFEAHLPPTDLFEVIMSTLKFSNQQRKLQKELSTSSTSLEIQLAQTTLNASSFFLLNQGKVIGLLKQLARILKDLHEIGIAHCDLKSDNILYFAETNSLKLCDFGASHQLLAPLEKDESGFFCFYPFGTLEYFPPELIKVLDELQKTYNDGCQSEEEEREENEKETFEKSKEEETFIFSKYVDHWSFGVLAFEMVFGDTPFSTRMQKMSLSSWKEQDSSTTLESSSDSKSDFSLIFSRILSGSGKINFKEYFPLYHCTPEFLNVMEMIVKNLLVDSPMQRWSFQRVLEELETFSE
jgi:serine/threonine protein kinase